MNCIGLVLESKDQLDPNRLASSRQHHRDLNQAGPNEQYIGAGRRSLAEGVHAATADAISSARCVANTSRNSRGAEDCRV